MKEAQIFENWINNLSEGTWALPETPEQMEKLNQLMSAELIVGPDATNATELLYDIVGDDELFDILNDLADRSEGRANIWDDSDVQRRLAELGVQTPQSTEAEPADVAQDTAPEMKEGQLELNTPDPVVVIQDKQGKILDKINLSVAAQKYKLGEPGNIKKQLAHQNYTTVGNYTVVSPMTGQPQDQTTLGQKNTLTAEGDNLSTFEQDRELAEMLKYAGVPIREGVLNDSTGSTMDHIQDRFRRDIKDFTETGDMSDDLYDALYDYYFDDMPYGTKKARTGDPHEWVADRFADDLGLDEGVLGTLGGAALGGMLGGPIGAADGAVGGQEMTKGGSGLIEGSCNMTMEGDYCPEHGLAKCESMYEGVLGKLFGTEKKKKAQGQLRPYMIYDKFTIYVDPVDGEWVVAGTGEYENKFEPKATPMYGQTGDPELLVMYAMKHTGGGFGIRDPLKVNKEALRGVQEDGGAVGMPYSMGEGQPPHPKELEMDALVRSMQIKQRADDAEKRLAQRAAEPHNLGQKIKKDIGDPLSKLFKGDVKGALSEIDDPINSNSAMTGSYYEGKETDVQAGDALLARIKSLALLR